MAYSTKHAVNEASYALTRSGRYIGGQIARMGLRLVTAVGAAFAGISGNTGFFYVSGLIGVGTGIGLQAYLNHKDFEHSKEELASIYQKEAASFLGKSAPSITVQDIELLGKYNPSIREHIDHERTKRNVKTGIWIVAGALGFIAASALVTAAAVATPVAALAGFSTFMVGRAISKPIAEKMYGVNEPTTVDIVKSLEWKRTKGQKVSRAQVMEAYVSANPKLEQMIERQFGKSFMELDMADQHRVMLQFGDQVMLDEVTQAINEHRMNARELTFRVHGQVSGVYPDPSYKEQWESGVSAVKQKTQELQQNVKQVGQRALNSVNQMMGRSQSDEEPAVSEAAPEEQAPSTEWRDKIDARRAQAEANQQQGI